MYWWYGLMEIINFHKQILHVVQRCCHNLQNSLNKGFWVLFQLVHMWTYCKLKSWGSTCSEFKRRLEVVIKCLFRSSTLTVMVWFFGLSIWCIKCQILLGLLSFSADVKNFFLVVHIAWYNLFWTVLYAIQSGVF